MDFKFHVIREYNDHEGEVWTYFLQPTGNDHLVDLIYAISKYESPDTEITYHGEIDYLDARAVVMHTRHLNGYYPAFGIHYGILNLRPEDLNETVIEDLYKGGILDYLVPERDD